jgi:hypothetical protein
MNRGFSEHGRIAKNRNVRRMPLGDHNASRTFSNASIAQVVSRYSTHRKRFVYHSTVSFTSFTRIAAWCSVSDHSLFP